MLYPLKFNPVYKDYIWGGRNFEKFGRDLPDGIIAESWEVSCHPNGISVVSNGEYKGATLPVIIKELGQVLMGSFFSETDMDKFPLLVKFIDANRDLSVQVHPDDDYAFSNENGEFGKNEMWYVISAEPGARLVFDLVSRTSKEAFLQGISNSKLEECLRYIDVFPGDILNIPSGLVHGIGKGIILAEIQQSSDATYRLYDYNRVDKDGNRRPLHIDKAIDVISFNKQTPKNKTKGIKLQLNSYTQTYLVANKYFSVELLDTDTEIDEGTDGSKFHILSFIEGDGEILFTDGCIKVRGFESLLIPAAMGSYKIRGKVKLLKTYVPDLKKEIIEPLTKQGYKEQEILASLG